MLLVTGITGHSGGYFLEELIANKYEGPIRCIVRESSNTSLIDRSGLNIEKMVGTLDDESFLDSAMVDVDTILHIAGIGKTPKVIDAAIKNNVNRVILVHTTGIYSKYKSASQMYKDIEDNLRAKIDIAPSDIKVSILRPRMIYGDMCDHNISTFIRMVGALRVFPVINMGSGLIQPVNARDLGRAYYQVLITEQTIGEDYVLSGNDVVTMLDMFKRISSTMGKKTFFVNVPVSVGVLLALGIKLVTLNKIDYVEKVQRMVEDRCYSNEKARIDFNYNPMNFFEGLDREVKEYMAP